MNNIAQNNNTYFGLAIHSLRPNAEFILHGDDLENIIWFSPEITKPTRIEVETEADRLRSKNIPT